MNTANLTTVATKVIDGFDTAAHQAIGFWREGGDRLAELAADRWETAFEQSKAQLSAETRRNATHAKKVFAGYYSKGLQVSTSGAEVAVDTVVQAAREAVQRAAVWQQSRA
jgi:hypothetical protein